MSLFLFFTALFLLIETLAAMASCAPNTPLLLNILPELTTLINNLPQVFLNFVHFGAKSKETAENNLFDIHVDGYAVFNMFSSKGLKQQQKTGIIAAILFKKCIYHSGHHQRVNCLHIGSSNLPGLQSPSRNQQVFVRSLTELSSVGVLQACQSVNEVNV